MITLAKKRIKDVFNDTLEKVRTGKKVSISKTMLEKGYSKSSSRALKITQTKTWDKLLKEIDDEEIIDKVKTIMRDEDKRSSLTAADMLLKLKDRYPTPKTNIVGLFGNLDGLKEKE